jgi:hypothetical protein
LVAAAGSGCSSGGVGESFEGSVGGSVEGSVGGSVGGSVCVLGSASVDVVESVCVDEAVSVCVLEVESVCVLESTSVAVSTSVEVVESDCVNEVVSVCVLDSTSVEFVELVDDITPPTVFAPALIGFEAMGVNPAGAGTVYGTGGIVTASAVRVSCCVSYTVSYVVELTYTTLVLVGMPSGWSPASVTTMVSDRVRISVYV